VVDTHLIYSARRLPPTGRGHTWRASLPCSQLPNGSACGSGRLLESGRATNGANGGAGLEKEVRFLAQQETWPEKEVERLLNLSTARNEICPTFRKVGPVERLKRVEEFPPGLLPRRRESCLHRLLTLRNGRRSTARNPPGARPIGSRTLLPRRLARRWVRVFAFCDKSELHEPSPLSARLRGNGCGRRPKSHQSISTQVNHDFLVTP
jgi:hypothetical protein